MTEEIEQNWQSWGGFAIVAGVAVGVVIAIMIVVGVALTLIGRRKRWAGQLRERVSWPFRITLLLVALTVSISALPVSAGLRGGLEHLFGILVIIAGAWLPVSCSSSSSTAGASAIGSWRATRSRHERSAPSCRSCAAW